MSRKKHKKSQPSALDVSEVDEQLLLDPNYFYWIFIRPAEADAEERKKRRAERRAKQKARFAAESTL